MSRALLALYGDEFIDLWDADDNLGTLGEASDLLAPRGAVER